MNVPRYLAGYLGQLATLAQDDPTDHAGQSLQVPSQIALRLLGIQLLQLGLYGTIGTAAVTHGVAPCSLIGT